MVLIVGETFQLGLKKFHKKKKKDLDKYKHRLLLLQLKFSTESNLKTLIINLEPSFLHFCIFTCQNAN